MHFATQGGVRKKKKERGGKKKENIWGEKKKQIPKESALEGMSECAGQEFMRTSLRDLKARKTRTERSSLL